MATSKTTIKAAEYKRQRLWRDPALAVFTERGERIAQPVGEGYSYCFWKLYQNGTEMDSWVRLWPGAVLTVVRLESPRKQQEG